MGNKRYEIRLAIAKSAPYRRIADQLKVRVGEDILDKLYTELNTDQISARTFNWIEANVSGNCRIEIEEYEPETAIFKFDRVDSQNQKVISKIFKEYRFAFGSGSQYRTEEESLRMFEKGIESIKIKSS